MRIGTKSLLVGGHQFILHPLFLAVAWTKLYGFPLDPRLWMAFIVHDWGYWGKPNMDGAEGEMHPELGGKLMSILFGKEWGDFTRFHSRSYARAVGGVESRLCAADKLATVLVPKSLYIFLVFLSGEHHEYIKEAKMRKDLSENGGVSEWYDTARSRSMKWLRENTVLYFP